MQKAKVSRKRKPRESPETLLEQVEHYGTRTEDGERALRRARMPSETITSKILGKDLQDFQLTTTGFLQGLKKS